MAIRVKDAAKILGLSPITVRRWCNDGKLKYTLSAAGQRIFDEDYLNSIKNKANSDHNTKSHIIFYARSSTKNDILVETQIKKLSENFGEPDVVFTDNASGLNENRHGLNKMIEHIINTDGDKVVCITNKDRLTRFGFNYFVTLLKPHNCSIKVLDSDETKEPHEVLMQDFMSLLASFSGKFYRIRGWEQKRKFLDDVENEMTKNYE